MRENWYDCPTRPVWYVAEDRVDEGQRRTRLATLQQELLRECNQCRGSIDATLRSFSEQYEFTQCASSYIFDTIYSKAKTLEYAYVCINDLFRIAMLRHSKEEELALRRKVAKHLCNAIQERMRWCTNLNPNTLPMSLRAVTELPWIEEGQSLQLDKMLLLLETYIATFSPSPEDLALENDKIEPRKSKKRLRFLEGHNRDVLLKVVGEVFTMCNHPVGAFLGDDLDDPFVLAIPQVAKNRNTLALLVGVPTLTAGVILSRLVKEAGAARSNAPKREQREPLIAAVASEICVSASTTAAEAREKTAMRGTDCLFDWGFDKESLTWLREPDFNWGFDKDSLPVERFEPNFN